jgi:LPXTG-site transpeptidase (sortase) family protein
MPRTKKESGAPHKRRKYTNLVAYSLLIIGIVGLIISGVLYEHRSGPPHDLTISSVDVTSAPSSVKPTVAAVASYSVPPTYPKYISIPAIGISSTRIIRLGLLANGQIATPDNIFDTGWYDGSAKPGQSGAMFIYGHVSSWTADGVFYNLKKLKPGDDITITRGDNQTFTYSVVSTKIYPYTSVDMNAVLSPINPNLPGLNLMTCTGKVIPGTSEFNERLVVFTSLVKS